MKTIFVSLILIFSGYLYSQRGDLIKLKNGSQIRGKVTEQNDEQTKVATKDGSILVFKTGDIISVETYAPIMSKSGYYGRGSIGVMGGPGGASFSLQLVQGYRINPHWQLGAGFGFETIAGNIYVPAFIEGKYNLLNKLSSPFVKLTGGYEAPLNFSDSRGGFTSGAAVGYTYFITQHLGLTTSLGYRFARLVETGSWWEDFVTIRQINRFELRFGISFR